MTTIISIKGKNTRMGSLFKTPKHYLLKDGVPAIKRTFDYMKRFGQVLIVANEDDKEIDRVTESWFLSTDKELQIIKTPPDTGIVDMLLQMGKMRDFFVVDCDVIPLHLNVPEYNSTNVYCFENKGRLTCYSNFDVDDNGIVKSCNEKQEVFKWSGAGVYYFTHSDLIAKFPESKSLAQVMANLTKVKADTTSEIFRFGSLQTIHNNECN